MAPVPDDIDTPPPPAVVPVPPEIVVHPPATLSPAVRAKLPPVPALLAPTLILMSPAGAPVAPPEAMEMVPEAPHEAEAPVATLIAPLTPHAPASADEIVTDPVLVKALLPDVKVTLPPVTAAAPTLEPADKLS
jgi:hypothetical protein